MRSLPRLLVPAALGALLCPLLAAPAAGATSTTATVGGEQLTSTGIVAEIGPGGTRLPRVSASSYLVADADTGEVLAAKNPHGRFRPASTQKILTAVTVMPELDPDSVYT